MILLLVFRAVVSPPALGELGREPDPITLHVIALEHREWATTVQYSTVQRMRADHGIFDDRRSPHRSKQVFSAFPTRRL